MIKNLGFNFDNTYADLPEIMATKLSPIAVKKPKLVILNKILAKSLGLDLSKISDEQNAEIFSGNKLIEGPGIENITIRPSSRNCLRPRGSPLHCIALLLVADVMAWVRGNTLALPFQIHLKENTPG